MYWKAQRKACSGRPNPIQGTNVQCSSSTKYEIDRALLGDLIRYDLPVKLTRIEAGGCYPQTVNHLVAHSKQYHMKLLAQ